MIAFFLIPHNLSVNITPLCMGLPDAVSGSQVVRFIEQAQPEELLLLERYLWIVSF